mgnify:FL=1|jgi:hypothetical protein
MSVRPIRSSQRYLSLNLNVCTEICPDWLLVFFELLRQQKIQGLAPGDMIEMRKPIWDAAGVITTDRRKKVMDHLERVFPDDIVRFRRQRGSVPLAIVGPKMVEFHSKSGSAATTQLIPNNVSGAILDPVTQGAEFKG